MAQWVKNPTRIHENEGVIPGLHQWVRISIVMSYGVRPRRGSDLVLPWL